MRTINREDVVQAALTVERWCTEHKKETQDCDCPFNRKDGKTWIGSCLVLLPALWDLEPKLRNVGRGHECCEPFVSLEILGRSEPRGRKDAD